MNTQTISQIKVFARRTGIRTPLAEKPAGRVVLAHDWGNDDAEANIRLVVESIGRVRGRNVDVTIVPGIEPLASPLVGAVILHRFLDTIRLTAEHTVKLLEANGVSKERISQRFGPVVLLNIFDIGVGSERVPAAARGDLMVAGEKGTYLVPITLVGPIDNGIIGSLAARLQNLVAFDIRETATKLGDLGCKTWDGRTLFGPTTGHLAAGVGLDSLGLPPLDLGIFPRIELGHIQEGEKGSRQIGVLDIDTIGNLVVGLSNNALTIGKKIIATFPNGREIEFPVGRIFADVPTGRHIAYNGSNGHVELAINEGSLAQQVGLRRRDLGLLKEGLVWTPSVSITVGET